MITIITLLIVGVSAYIWCTRGFFSALLHMFCTIAAGAIAFGVWEPLGYLILTNAPQRGFGSFLTDVPFSLALVLPFAISLAVLRAIVDKILPANAQCDGAADYVGGGVCGLVAGIITAGIVLLSIGMLRVKPDFGGYQAAVYATNANGAIVRNPGKFVPWVDRLTTTFYSHLSLTTLRTGAPLAKYHPDLDLAVGANRLTYDGKSRTGIRKDGFSLVGWYTVGDPQDAFARPRPLKQLTIDYRQEKPQKVVDVEGEDINDGALVGYIVKFSSSARENTGQVVIGAGQVRLVCEGLEEEVHQTVFPIAVVSRVNDPTRRHYARFRFDSDDFFVSSVGGESDAVLGFEFPVPAGYRPVALYVKNVRVPLEELTAQPERFSSPSERDGFITDGRMAGMKDVGPILDPNTGRPVQMPETVETWIQDPVRVTPSLGFVIQKGTERRLEVADEGRAGYAIRQGELTIGVNEVRRGGQIDAKLRIDRFSTSDDTVMIQLDLTPRNRSEEFVRNLESAEKTDAPTLIDVNGNRYQAVGFLYKETSFHRIRYTRGQPIRNLQELPSVTRNTPDKSLLLLFIVSKGVNINEFRIGNQLIETYKPPLQATGN